MRIHGPFKNEKGRRAFQALALARGKRLQEIRRLPVTAQGVQGPERGGDRPRIFRVSGENLRGNLKSLLRVVQAKFNSCEKIGGGRLSRLDLSGEAIETSGF